MIIFYNPKCSKCREARELLESNQCDFEIREYLQEPPSPEELKELLKLLGCKASDIVRKTEPLFIENYKDKKISEARWLRILSKHPILIERPIVIDGEKAIVGRPPSLVLNLVPKKKRRKVPSGTDQ
jgi:arsenate reductase